MPQAVQISIVWVPSDWEEPPVTGGQAEFALDPHNELAVHSVTVSVPGGQTVQACIDAHLTPAAREKLARRTHGVSLWGRRIRTAQQVTAGDRIELLGPISADPKSDRRARVQQERQALATSRWRR